MNSIFKTALALALSLLATVSWAQSSRGSLLVGQQQRSYLIELPPGAAPPSGFPLVLAFHGGGMQGLGMEKISLLDQQAEQHRFIVLYPDGIDKHWNDGRSTIRNPQDDVAFVAALIAQVAQRYPVDKARIFATGISNGALFTERLGCELASQIAAIAPVAGTLPSELIGRCHPAKKVAVLQIDGDADPIMPFAGGAVKDFNGRGEGGLVSSVADTAAFWAKHNGCQGPGASEPLPAKARFDRTRIERQRFKDCPTSSPVEVLTVVGGGHVWPGGNQPFHPFITGRPSRQIDASAVIADFFLTLPKRP